MNGTTTLHVLVVDDDAGVARLLCRLLERLGHATETAAGPESARGLVDGRGDAFDLVFVDSNLDDRADGVRLAAELRGRLPRARLVLMSGEPVDAPDVDAFLAKPFGLADLRSLLQADGPQ